MALILAVAGLYGHTLHVGFYLDDNALFNGTYWLRDLPAAAQRIFSQRGLTNFTFAVNYRFSGWSLLPLHLVNIVLHAACGLLAWRLLRHMIGAGWLPLLGALLFVAHPLQTQGVTYLAQRSTVLGTFLFLLAFLCHLRARAALVVSPERRGAAYWRWYLAAVVVGTGAVLAKENTATLPLVLIVYDQLFPRAEARSRWQALFDYLPFFVVPLLLGGITLAEQAAAKAVGSSLYPLESLQHNSPLHYLVTQFSVIWSYLRLLILPWGQALEHDYAIVAQLLTVRSALALLGLLVVGWLAWQARRRRPLLVFGVAWFFLALAVESSVIPLDPLFEHRLYLPMFGFVLLLCDGLTSLPNSRLAMLALALAVLACLPLTWRRNALWNDPIALYEDNLWVVPNSERAMMNLASLYEEARQFNQLNDLQRRAIKLYPHNNVFLIGQAGLTYNRLGLQPALSLIDDAIERLPDNYALYRAAALMSERHGVPWLVFHYLSEGVNNVTFGKWELLNDLGNYYIKQGDMEKAEGILRRSLELFEDNPATYQHLANICYIQQRWREAFELLQTAQRLQPGNPTTLNGLVNVARKLEDDTAFRWAEEKLRYAVSGEIEAFSNGSVHR